MKKIGTSLNHMVFILCFFLIGELVTGQPKGVDCDNVTWTFTRDLNYDCRYIIKFKSTYSTGNVNGMALPHGIYIKITGGTVAGVGSLSSSLGAAGWFTSMPVPTQVLSSAQDEIFWIKQVHCGGSSATDLITHQNAIKSNESLKIAVDIAPVAGSPSIKIHAEFVYGFSWPYCLPISSNPQPCGTCSVPAPTSVTHLDCPGDTIIPHLPNPYQIICNNAEDYPLFIPIPDCMLCLPDDNCANLTLSANLPPSPVTTIEWYKCTTCPIPCPTTVTDADLMANNSPWTLDMTQVYTGGPQPFYPTGQLFYSTCYVAKVKRGCDTWITDPLTLWVCQPLPAITISATPALTWLNDPQWHTGWHACEQWSGTLSIPPAGFTCPAHITWEQWDYNHWDLIQSLNYTPPFSNPVPNPFEINVSNLVCLPSTIGCDSLYTFRMTIDDICTPVVSKTIDIYIDKKTEDCPYTFAADPQWIGTVTGATIQNPIFCDSGATVLKLNAECLKIKQWEISEVSDPCGSATWGPWTVLSQAGSSPTWWTNILTKSTKYRAWVYNGTCYDANNPVYTNEVIVTIIPKPSLSLATDKYYICPGCSLPTLTATITCPTINTFTSYHWMHDGTIVATTPGNTFQPSVPGLWSCIANGGICGPLVSDNAIVICGSPTLSIDGPCCFCAGESVTLTANVQGCNIQTILYEWRNSSGQLISTNSSITVSSADTYSVMVIIDGCCILTANKTVTLCPSTHP